MGNLQKAWLSYDQALRIDPANDYVLNNYAYFLSEQNENLEDAEKMSRKTIEKNPKSATYLDTYGWIKFKQGDYAEAVKYLEMAKQYSETPGGEILEHLGDAYFKSGRIEEAVVEWEAAKKAGGASVQIDAKIENKKL
jgi:Tfp pilus assembly protein PilF